jgi:hypothetical protein
MEDWDLPHTFSVPLQQEKSGELSGVSDATFVGADDVGDFSVSTTISDVRYGEYTDGIDSTTRAACMIVLKFGFAQHFSKRIKKLSIKLSFSPEAQSPSQPIAPDGAASEKCLVPELRLYEPSSGRGRSNPVTRSFGQSAGISVGLGIGGGVHISSAREQTAAVRLDSIQESHDAVRWLLQENTCEKKGIPSELNCAVVLRTDSKPFVGSVKFTAQIRSVYWNYTGSKTSLIDSSHFRNRLSRLSEEKRDLLGEMGSDQFRAWVKENVSNDWIVSTT